MNTFVMWMCDVTDVEVAHILSQVSPYSGDQIGPMNFISKFQETSSQIDYNHWSDKATYGWLYQIHSHVHTFIQNVTISSSLLLKVYFRLFYDKK